MQGHREGNGHAMGIDFGRILGEMHNKRVLLGALQIQLLEGVISTQTSHRSS